MKVFGLTGGIGMGKSTAGGLLREIGVAVIDTDVLAREVVEPGQPALAAVVAAFGREVLESDGRLARQNLAGIVFKSPEARRQLEAILHPRIRAAWLRQLELWRAEARPMAAVIIPLLFETNARPHVNTALCLACTRQTQEARLASRGWTPQQIEDRRQAQMPIEEKVARSDFVVWTEGSLEVHAEQLRRIIGSGAA